MIEILSMILALQAGPMADAAPVSALSAAATDEARARRLRSEAVLLEQGVPFDEDAPLIAASAPPIDVEAVIARLRAVEIVQRRAAEGDYEGGRRALERLGDQVRLTPREAAYMVDPAPSRADEARFIGYDETAAALIWALGWLDYTGPLGRPETRDPDVFPIVMSDEPIDPADASPRREAELLDTADLAFLYARAADAETPGWFDPVVALERHRALAWLIDPRDEVWDGKEDIR